MKIYNHSGVKYWTDIFSDLKSFDIRSTGELEELNTKLIEYFKVSLFDNDDLKYYASVCATVIKHREEKESALNLAEDIKNYITLDKKNWSFFSALDNIIYCEPFLSLLDNCFLVVITKSS